MFRYHKISIWLIISFGLILIFFCCSFNAQDEESFPTRQDKKTPVNEFFRILSILFTNFMKLLNRKFFQATHTEIQWSDGKITSRFITRGVHFLGNEKDDKYETKEAKNKHQLKFKKEIYFDTNIKLFDDTDRVLFCVIANSNSELCTMELTMHSTTFPYEILLPKDSLVLNEQDVGFYNKNVAESKTGRQQSGGCFKLNRPNIIINNRSKNQKILYRLFMNPKYTPEEDNEDNKAPEIIKQGNKIWKSSKKFFNINDKTCDWSLQHIQFQRRINTKI